MKQKDCSLNYKLPYNKLVLSYRSSKRYNLSKKVKKTLSFRSLTPALHVERGLQISFLLDATEEGVNEIGLFASAVRRLVAMDDVAD